MKSIVECVPNFSEGRNQDTINAIAEAIRQTKGCQLLDMDPGHSTNRTVYTFVGDPASIVEGALSAARVARERIDMRQHTGEHPRMGALDVCPFIPVANVSMTECVDISKTFARRAADELGVPFYLYEESAVEAYRQKLSQIRQGEYEGLNEKLADPRWKPDFGSAQFVAEWGATVTGARSFLIAYNVNILGTSQQAHRIALNLREAGRGPEAPGQLKEVKGMGWYVDEYNMAQVTVNLTNFHVTPPHLLYEAVKKEAAALNVGVAGSEIIGLIPLEALLLAADYYIAKEDLFILDDDQKIRLATERMGLNSISPFKPNEKIIEYMVAEIPEEPLAAMSVRAFIEEIAARSSAPGGGSASAAMAAIGVGLGAMVAKLTYGVRKFEHLESQMRKTILPLHTAVKNLIPLIDADTNAFKDYMEGLRMPRNTSAEKAARHTKMQAGLKTAIQVPLTTMRLGDEVWEAMCDVARYGNPASKSDVQVGARALETGIWGAYQNVLINMGGIEDQTYKADILKEAELMAARAQEKCQKVLKLLEQGL